MALKAKLKASAYDSIDDAMKKLYKKVGDDYELDIEGGDDAGAALRARDQEKEARKTAERKLADLEEKAAKDAEEIARKAGDFKSIEDSYKAKIEKMTKDHAEAMEKVGGQMNKMMVTDVAKSVATEICTVPSMLAPLIAARLTVDNSGDTPITRVKGLDGKASAMSVEDLKNEFKSNKEYAKVIIASKGSGGGAPNSQLPAGGRPQLPQTPEGKPMMLSQLTPAQLAQRTRERREAAGQQQQE